MQTYPNHLGGFAALPLPDIDGALEELTYALDELKLDGVVLFSNARGLPRRCSLRARLRGVRAARGGGGRASHDFTGFIGPPPRPAGFLDRFHGRHHLGRDADAVQQWVHPDQKGVGQHLVLADIDPDRREIYLEAARREFERRRPCMGRNGQSNVALNGAAAMRESYCLAPVAQVQVGRRSHMVAPICFLDTFTKQAERWLFSERRAMVDWPETRPV